MSGYRGQNKIYGEDGHRTTTAVVFDKWYYDHYNWRFEVCICEAIALHDILQLGGFDE